MGVLCLTCRTVGRQLALRKGLLILALTLSVLLMLVAYSFTQYSVALQVVSESPSTRIELEQSEIPIVVKHAVINELPKVDNSSVVKETPHDDVVIVDKVVKVPPKVEKTVDTYDDSTYLKLSGHEEECVFSSTSPEKKPTINVLDVMDSLPYDNKDGGVWKQGYDITYDTASFEKEPLQVFVVPHSHNDPGWIKTFEQYYNQDTRNILNNVVNALAEDEKRRFIWAEISFFELWWSEQPQDRRNLAKKLISNGQLEIVTGGWVMNDEANTHYFAMVDQLMEGHQWLHDNVGVKPLSGWAIDPFGYTPTMAYLLQRMGFHNMLIQRTHYAIKKYFSQQKQLEYLWRQNWDHSTSTDMLCHMMPFYSYDVPHTCGPDPKICCQFDFKRLPGSRISCPWRIPAQHITGSNVKERAMTILDQYRKKAQLYRTNVLLVPLGDDFRYDTSSETHDQYNNYQRIFMYFNDHPELNVKGQFGTLNDYFTALRKTTGVTGRAHPNGFPSLVGDFFTYCDREVDYWSGYYTSRPFYKNLDRILEDRLRAAEIIYSLAMSQSVVLPAGLDDKLTRARRSLGLFQHHDGITGTAKNHVVVDYGNKLLDAVNGADHVMAAAAQALLLGDSQSKSTASNLIFDVDETRAQHDSLPDKTIINLSSDQQRVVYLYNSLTHKRQEMISLLVDSASASVYDASNNPISCQVNPVVTSDGIAQSKYELVFVANMAPLSLTKYSIAGVAGQLTTRATLMCSGDPPSSSLFKTSTITSQSSFTLHTDHLAVTFDGSTGLLQSVKKHDSDNVVRTNIDFTVYPSRSSGAYLFLPNGGAQSIVGKSTSFCVTNGSLLHRVRVTMAIIDHIVQVANSPGVDGQSVYIMNTVDVRRENDKELVMKLSTSINNGDRTFYTDLNGFQTARRKTMDKLTTQGNFYPMPSYMFLQDTTSRVMLLTGQPLGVASRQTGVMEVVLDRRLSMDDRRGLGHGVTDNKVTLSNFRLLVEHRSSVDHNPTRELSYPSLMAHYTSSILVLPVHHFIVKPNSPPATALAPSYAGLRDQLPCDVHMLNLRSIFKSGHREAALLLHRKGFDCGFSTKPLTCRLTNGQVPVKEIFTSSPSSSVKTTLTLMYPVEESTDHINPMEITTNRLSWET